MCLGELQQVCHVVVVDIDVLHKAIVLQEDLVVLVAVRMKHLCGKASITFETFTADYAEWSQEGMLARGSRSIRSQECNAYSLSMHITYSRGVADCTCIP